ncbi:MAG: ATP-binding cassette domain-containing protein [Kiritimatiellae bacterium]|nr:ATP-binding cassette domain-containing protein [Kiritimatiellia bacterium]
MCAEPISLDPLRAAEWSVYRRLLGYARPYAGRLALGVVFGILFGGSTAGILGALKENLANIFNPQEVPLRTTILIAALLPAFALLRGIGDYLSRYLVEWVGNRVVTDLRAETFGHIHDLSLLYFTRSRTGELISRTTNDSMLVQRAVANVIGDLVREPFVLLVAVGWLLWLDARLAAASLLLFPIAVIPVALFGRKVRRFAREGQQKLADLISILQETITGARVVKAFGMEEHEKTRFNRENRSVFSRVMRVARAKAAVEPIIVFISLIGMSCVLLYARWVRMSYDDFFTFAAALVVMYQPVKKLSRIHLEIQHSCAAADRIFEIIDTEVTVRESPEARPFEGAVRNIRFENVAFAYDAEPVLRDINLHVSAGECIAIVGSSGTGKTTCVSLLPRFFDVTAGAILINGLNIRQFTLASLRRQIGIVTQETILFNDTVANNIAYGESGAAREAIIESARRAHAHDFIMAMPEGYETVIGERGMRLSGGQCQRLAIARAMLRNPPILILDEATSSLDTESERQVQAALDELMANRTVFAIAHRLSTITHADRIIVLDGGCVVEEGPHRDLLALGGIYKRLYDLQFQDQAQAARSG